MSTAVHSIAMFKVSQSFYLEMSQTVLMLCGLSGDFIADANAEAPTDAGSMGSLPTQMPLSHSSPQPQGVVSFTFHSALTCLIVPCTHRGASNS